MSGDTADGHTRPIFDDVFEFARDVAPFDVQTTYPTPFPGTPMDEHMSGRGSADADGPWDRCTLLVMNLEPGPMTGDELRAG